MPRGGPRPNSGGKRPGAGRKPGSGWKPAVRASSFRVATAEWRTSAAEHAAALVGSDRDPLLFLVDQVFDTSLNIATRVGCAAIAARYLHPTLSATTVSAQHTVIRADSAELLGRLTDRIAKLTGPATIEIDQAEQPAGGQSVGCSLNNAKPERDMNPRVK